MSFGGYNLEYGEVESAIRQCKACAVVKLPQYKEEDFLVVCARTVDPAPHLKGLGYHYTEPLPTKISGRKKQPSEASVTNTVSALLYLKPARENVSLRLLHKGPNMDNRLLAVAKLHMQLEGLVADVARKEISQHSDIDSELIKGGYWFGIRDSLSVENTDRASLPPYISEEFSNLSTTSVSEGTRTPP